MSWRIAVRSELAFGIAMLRAFFILWCTAACAVEAHRFEARDVDRVIDGKPCLTTIKGTAFVRRGMVWTAWHNVKDGGTPLIETDRGWIRCDLVRHSAGFDYAVLKPRVKLDDDTAHEDGCWASVRGEAVKQLWRGTLCENWHGPMKGFDDGGSGAPIYYKGKVAAIVTGYKAGDKTWVWWTLVKDE